MSAVDLTDGEMSGICDIIRGTVDSIRGWESDEEVEATETAYWDKITAKLEAAQEADGPSITVRRIGYRKPTIYVDLDAFILSTCEWYDENESNCQLDVAQDDRLIYLEYTHYDMDDGDTQAVIIKDELFDGIDVKDLIAQLEACC